MQLPVILSAILGVVLGAILVLALYVWIHRHPVQAVRLWRIGKHMLLWIALVLVFTWLLRT